MWPFKKTHPPQPAPPDQISNGLFLCPVSVRASPACDNPGNWSKASVFCYVGASDHMAALRIAVDKLKNKGWLFEDLLGGQVHQLDAHKWGEYVASTWPELPDYFPSQAEVIKMVETGAFFFGPFCGAAPGTANG